MYTSYPDIVLPSGKIKSTDIPQFPPSTYEVATRLKSIEEQVTFHIEGFGLNLDPDFQREHVWTKNQRIAYMEYLLQGGEVAKTLIFSCKKWREGNPEEYVLVDGKQRLESIRAFIRNELPVFGKFYGDIQLVGLGPMINWRVVEVNSREDALRLYLSLNCGGTPHSKKELDRVRGLLVKETSK